MTTVEERTTTEAAERSSHPLDPLTPAEMQLAADIIRAHASFGEHCAFVQIGLREPPKDELRGRRPDSPPARCAEAVIIDRENGNVFEAVANLTAAKVDSWIHRPGVQPYPLFEEFGAAIETTKSDPRWQKAMLERGITDFDKVQIDPWPAGNFNDPDEQGHRILRCISYIRDEPASNGYSRPVEGLIAVVDLIENRVIKLVDERPAPIPEGDLRYYADGITPRDGLKPLDIVQPEGVSFSLEGHLLRWQKWQMRVSHNPREGLILHEVAYDDDGDLRSICYRASMAEMVVPYGDPTAGQYFKNAFDSGEVGLGRLVNSLALGCDCLGVITYMDGLACLSDGTPRVIQNAICIHEEDFNILWKHTDGPNGDHPEARRARRLVVSSWATVGNYDYGFYWYFYQDGSWEQEVKATGIIQTMAVDDGTQPGTRQRIAKNLAGPIHQHFFCFRLDMDVDGDRNTVYEVDTEPLPEGPDNPWHNAFHPVATPIESEREAGRTVNAGKGRFWRVASGERTNTVGEPTAYALMPGETVAMMAGEQSMVAKRAAFARKQLWVTHHADDERYPAGDYPAQTLGGDGIPAFVSDGRSLVDEDVVLWYVVGLNHIVRPEDWPVTPVHRAGFRLMPWGFFDHNPALDVPAPKHACHCEGDCTC